MLNALQPVLPPNVAGQQLNTSPGLVESPHSKAEDQRFRDLLARQLMSGPSPYRAAYDSADELSSTLAAVPTAALKRIDGAARQLEGLLLETMLKQMWATLPKSSLLGNGLEAKFYREMWLEELAGEISADGPGTGVAATLTWEMIEQYLPQDS
jgi:Rod binding domain-containing protein